MELNKINSSMTNWGAEAANLNENFDKVSTAIEQVKNATIKSKGYFSSESALKLAIPTAAKGDKAYVGNNYPYQIWIWNGSSWGDSGSVGGEESVNLGNYHTKEYTDAKLSELGSNESRTYQGEHNAYSSIKFSENPLKEGGILFNRGVSVTIANINDNSIKNTISSGTEFLLPYTAKGSLLCGATSGTVDLEYHYYNGKKNAIDTKKELEGIDSNRVLKSNNKNLIIVENLINNFFINNTGGFSSNSSYSITEYIPIDAMTDYYLSRANGTYPGSNATYWNIYDKNLNIIFSGNTALISTPKDAKYLRCTLENSTVHSIMLEKGNTRTEFVKGSPIAGYIKDIEQTLSNVSQNLGDVSSNVYSTSKIDYYGEKEAYAGIKLSEGLLKAGGKITNRGIRIQIYNAATDEITAIPSNSVYILPFDAKGTAIAGSSSGIADVSYEYYVTQKDAIESINEVSESLISEINTIKEDIGNYTEEKPITLTKAAYGSINNIFIPKGSIITSFGGYNGGLLMCPYEQFTADEYTTIYQKNLPYTTLTDIKSIRPNADIDNTILYIDQCKGIKKSIELLNEKIGSIESGSDIKVKPLGSTYKGSLSDGDLIILEKNSVKGEDSFAFCANITNFNKIKIGRGTPYEKLYSSAWIEIDETNIVTKTYYSSTQSYENTYPHGLNIINNIQVLMYCSYDGKANIKLVSNGKMFEKQIGWNGFNGSIFVESEGSSFNDVVYSWTCKKLKSDIWLFGDSYFGFTSESRWLYYLINSGYKDVLINGYAGAGCSNAYSDVIKLLQHNTPKYIFWCMGMNNKDSETSANSTWMSTFEQLKEICTLNNIELIMSTIPTVKGGYVEDTNEYSIRIHKFKNAIVRESGLRYVDFDKAVGANETTGEWYGEMLYTDGVHPAADGARALFMQAVADFPELMSLEDC